MKTLKEKWKWIDNELDIFQSILKNLDNDNINDNIKKQSKTYWKDVKYLRWFIEDILELDGVEAVKVKWEGSTYPPLFDMDRKAFCGNCDTYLFTAGNKSKRICPKCGKKNIFPTICIA